MDIPNKIKRRRKVAGKTLADVSKATGISSFALSKIERGIFKKPSLAALCRIAEAVEDSTLLLSYCQACPVRAHLLRANQFKAVAQTRDPGDIAAKISAELLNAASLFDDLATAYTSSEMDQEEVERVLAEATAARRSADILDMELLLAGVRDHHEEIHHLELGEDNG